jgi:hypothetical protein
VSKFDWKPNDNPWALLPFCKAHKKWPCKECGSCHYRGCPCGCGGTGPSTRERPDGYGFTNRCPITAAHCERGCVQICRNAPNDTLPVNRVKIERGDILLRGDHEVRVMAVVENYVMARRKGAAPFLLEIKAAANLPIAKNGVRPKGWNATVSRESSGK